jgi:RNA polymerase sigma factor (sigma-70 family)
MPEMAVPPVTRAAADTDAPTEIRRLTAGLAEGAEEAFAQFHACFFDRLLRYLLVVTRGDEEAAREALQQTFIRVARHARQFHDEKVFWDWLTVLARTAAIDGARKHRSYWRAISRYAREWIRPPPAPPASEDPDHLWQALLRAGLNALEDLERSLVEGKYLRGATVRELAAETGLTEKAVESRLTRARRDLRTFVLEKLRHESAP